MALPPAMTKLAPKRIHTFGTWGGNKKYRALRCVAIQFLKVLKRHLLFRLVNGNFAWASDATARKTRVVDVAYNACNNDLVRCLNILFPESLSGVIRYDDEFYQDLDPCQE